jgi:MFS family permease
MSTTTADNAAVGPFEQPYMQSQAYRNARDKTQVTKTHYHIAVANGLGWAFDGMDGILFGLAAPFLIKDFGVDIPTWRTVGQIALVLGIPGIYFWPWLADKYGRRTLLAINIALFSLLMPLVALAPTLITFVIARIAVNFALNGEWALGSLLVAETWPAHLRGRVLSINRGTWCFGTATAGIITSTVMATYGWRWAMAVPGVIALLAVYVRAKCPESPYWVQTQDRKRRIAAERAAGKTLSAEDAAWQKKADKLAISQLFAPDLIKPTFVAIFVACCSTAIYGTVGGWMAYYLNVEMKWSPSEYGFFFTCWGIVGFFGLVASGWIADRIGRRMSFIVMLVEGAVFIFLWAQTRDHTLLWVYGLLWSIGFLGFWGPSMTITAEVFPTRIRGAANGLVWAIAWLIGFVLWPYVTVWLQQETGSFYASFMTIPALMVMMGIGVWLFVPEHGGKTLEAIAV